MINFFTLADVYLGKLTEKKHVCAMGRYLSGWSAACGGGPVSFRFALSEGFCGRRERPEQKLINPDTSSQDISFNASQKYSMWLRSRAKIIAKISNK
jgi:hypothetical protein